MSPSVRSLGRRGSSNFEVIITIWNSPRCSPENNSGYPGGILQDTPLPEAQLKQRVVQWAQKEPSYLPSESLLRRKASLATKTSRNYRPLRVCLSQSSLARKRGYSTKTRKTKNHSFRKSKNFRSCNILTTYSQDLMLVEYPQLSRIKELTTPFLFQIESIDSK